MDLQKLPLWLQGDPELAAGRDRLIRRMVGFAPWSEAGSLARIAMVLRFALAWAGLVLVLFLFLSFFISWIVDFDTAFCWSFYASTVLAALMVIARFCWIERKWHELRFLPNKEFLRVYDVWEARVNRNW